MSELGLPRDGLRITSIFKTFVERFFRNVWGTVPHKTAPNKAEAKDKHCGTKNSMTVTKC